jgi:N-acetylglucosaminyldiphosphoundecaprenol N-acetyl-beta-D-mannosaminyltransferase
MPVDTIGMHAVFRQIELAAAVKAPFFISAPSLNFLANSQRDPDFRESLLLSDLCTADGIPIVWIAWLAGIPIKNRTAASDISNAVKAEHSSAKRLKIYWFGGPKGVAAAASRAVNAQATTSTAVWFSFPGRNPASKLEAFSLEGAGCP